MSNEVVDLEDVVCGEVCFYAHTMLRAVLYEEFWKRLAAVKILEIRKILKSVCFLKETSLILPFRTSGLFGQLIISMFILAI